MTRRAATEPPTVVPGQVSADNDWRVKGRTLRVDEVIDPGTPAAVAVCTTITNDDSTTSRLLNAAKAAARGEKHWDNPQDRIGKQTRIKLTRFRPTSTGYRLLTEAPTGHDASPPREVPRNSEAPAAATAGTELTDTVTAKETGL